MTETRVASTSDGGTPGTPKSEFLRSVREALGRPLDSLGQIAPPDVAYHRLQEDLEELEDRALQIQERLRENRPEIVERFVDMAQRGGWNVHRVSGVEAVVGRVDQIVAETGASKVARSGQPVFDEYPIDTALEWRGIATTPIVRNEQVSRQELREEIRRSDVGLTGTDYAIAETGSLVILPRRGLSRLVSLVPPVHIAVVRPDEVIESLQDLFLLRRLEYYWQGGEMGSYLNFITGPSRTADIEMTIVQGVHGPRTVHLVLVE